VIRLLLVAAVVLSLAWAAAIVAAPVCLRNSSGAVRTAALAPYVIGSRVCHQVTARSFSLAGVRLPVCARCTGLYAGVPLGILAGLAATRTRIVAGRRAARLLAWAALPTVLTVLVERTGVAPVPGWLRALLGAAFSGAAAFAIACQLRAEDRGGR
jgi:hypothetical protein